MSEAHNKDISEKNINSNSGNGVRPPVSHPQNCRSECPYGHDRAFCFPCYKKLMEDMHGKRKV